MAFLLTPTSLRTVTFITVSLDTVLVYLTIQLHTPLHPFLSAPAHFLSCLLHTFSLNNHLSNLHIHNTTALHPYYSPTPIPTVLPLFPYHYHTNLPFSFPQIPHCLSVYITYFTTIWCRSSSYITTAIGLYYTYLL